jgi:hypothetical protein
MFAKRKAFVEQDHAVPLRSLGFMHGQRIAIIEFVRLLANFRAQIFFEPLKDSGEAFCAHVITYADESLP